MEKLEIKDFKNMIYETVNVMELKKEYLNYINVFPVRDGDTGNNLLSTFYTTKALIEHDSLKKFMSDLKKYLLSNARGNSGVIISQFYKGFCNYLIKCKYSGPKEFAKAIQLGYEQAYASVNNPVEGTMLTVLRGASIGAIQVVEKGESIIDVLMNSFNTAQKALKETINKLPILKDCGVVDAGGLGVLYMLGAWLRAFGIVPKYDPSLNNMIVKEPNTRLSKDYCVNILLKNCEYVTGVKRVLKDLGDSINLGEEEDLLRIHLHTSDPEGVKSVCSAFGEVIQFEVDDMSEQNEKFRKD